MSRELDAHREYLSDPARLEAFSRAIAEVVQPGQTVLDLGSGTGILGLFACRAGAKRVYSIDASGMIELARTIAQANGYDDRITFIKELSQRAALPELVDVVIADQIGHFGFEAGIVEYFTDARRRMLKPGGGTVPSRLDLQVAPVEHPEHWRHIEFWTTSPAGFDFRPARAIATNTGYPMTLSPSSLLGDPATGLSFDPSTPPGNELVVQCACTIRRAGTLHGLGGWFVAQLSPTVTMTNSPLVSDRINRRNVFFPGEEPIPVSPGEKVHATIRIRPKEFVVTWTIEIRQAGQTISRTTHSTMKGMLLSREDLARTRPDFVPSLTPWGDARRTVLALCDGRRPLAEIEREVRRRHDELFPTNAAAAAFVAEVITRYAR